MTPDSREPVGIIGIGLVGSVIADLLATSGFSLRGFDVAEVTHLEVEKLSSASDLFERCETVVLSLPNSEIVAEVLADAPLRREHLVIDTTTGTPDDAVAHADRLAEVGGRYLEATIAGSSDLLSKREAPVFLGGDADTIDDACALLDALTAKTFHVGDVGQGAKFKLMFNLMLGLHRAVLGEALSFGESQGIDPAFALDVLRQTPAFSSVMETKGKRMVHRDFDEPQARLSQHLKDVRIILESGGVTPLSETHRELLEFAQELGFGDKDTSAIIEAYRRRDS